MRANIFPQRTLQRFGRFPADYFSEFAGANAYADYERGADRQTFPPPRRVAPALAIACAGMVATAPSAGSSARRRLCACVRALSISL
jgi:hypothetical protein